MSNETNVVEDVVADEVVENTEGENTEGTKRSRIANMPNMQDLTVLLIRGHAAGRSLAEIATEIGCSVNTLQQRATEYRSKYGLPIPKFTGGNKKSGPTREEQDKAAAAETRKMAEKLLAELNGK